MAHAFTPLEALLSESALAVLEKYLPLSEYQKSASLLKTESDASALSNIVDLGLSSEGFFSLRERDEPKWKPYEFNFSETSFFQRVLKTKNAKEMLRDALKVQGKFQSQRVLDGTLGVGHDGFMMALWGHTVCSFERNPFLFACVSEAWRIFRETQFEIASSMDWQIRYGDVFGADATTVQGDVLYLDPMYPHPEERSALNKKELRLVARLVNDLAPEDEEISSYLEQAREFSVHKIILKRPQKASVVVAPAGMSFHQIQGSSTRLDIYRTNL